MKVMIMGMDGYLGWSLSMYLADRGHEVCGIDNMLRRKMVAEIGSQSITPIQPMKVRLEAYKKASGNDLTFYKGDLTESAFVDLAVKKEQPDCIVQLGQVPSAPYSMIDVDHCNFVQHNNIIGHNNILFAIRDNVWNAERGHPGGVLRDRVPWTQGQATFSKAAWKLVSPHKGP